MAFFYKLLCLYYFLALICCCVNGEHNSDTYTVWSKSYPTTILGPYKWSNLRVELPPRFSSLTITLDTDIELNPNSIAKRDTHRLPTMCFRPGAPPLPDFSQTALKNFELYNVYDEPSKEPLTLDIKKCYAIQGNLSFELTNEQITEGVLFIGLFNGIGPSRNQAKMINRGKSYTFSAFISVEACNGTTFWGQFCDKKLQRLGCHRVRENGDRTQNQTKVAFGRGEIVCKDHLRSCHSRVTGPKLVLLNVELMSKELIFSVYDIKFGDTLNSTNNTGNGILSLKIYARNGAIPTESIFDYSTDLVRRELIVLSPKLGSWYFYIVPLVVGGSNGEIQANQQLCYSLRWKILGYTLKGKDQESPIIQVDGTEFLSNSLEKTSGEDISSDDMWTYILMEVPENASSRNIRMEIESNTSIDYEVYARFGGLASLEMFDYYYTNQTSNSNNGLSLFELYESSTQRVKFYIIYAEEGLWTFGLRKRDSSINFESQTNLSISLESCSNNCSGYGQCKDANALTSCSFCQCDVFHGGFDCSIEMVSRAEQKLQIVFLIGTNAAAILPAIYALSTKSYAEWVVFLSSGIASATYHACDVQWVCVLRYSILHFMDFWLSYMAVISTFIYITSIGEAIKRAILSVMWILTALVIVSDATSSFKISWFVIIIAISCLLIPWLLETSTKLNAFSTLFQRPINLTSWFLETLKKIRRHFRWGLLIVGFVGLGLAVLSWNLENSQNYWICHSIWHLSSYTAAFFFLCSKVNVQNERPNPNLNNDVLVTTASPDRRQPSH